MIHYTKEYISRLLDKYMDGTTTLEEEDILSRYLAKEAIPAEWEPYRQLFAEIEAMKPQAKPKRRWPRWSIAAAVIGIALLTIWTAIDSPSEQPLTAEEIVKTKDSIEQDIPQAELLPDTISVKPHDNVTTPKKRRSLRKSEPTPADYAKAYALIAEAEQERQEAESHIEQAELEIVHARLLADGYIPVQQEDGTVVYIEEPNRYLVYEE